ncbi:hypothetical protein E4U41_003843 [Claviceps citrina]|nr:hypothetical protein E4U41_003843 [Claviceps citrina]
MAAKDPITCHILDTTTGRPAKAVRVRLEGAAPPSQSHPPPTKAAFESSTDEDGRISVWRPCSSDKSAGEVVPVRTLDDVLGQPGSAGSTWTLRFDTAAYFGDGKTFFPEVVVVFRVEGGQRYHVPLLLGPYSYTTYRGS